MCLKFFIFCLFVRICRPQIFNPSLSPHYEQTRNLKLPEKMHISMHVPDETGSLKKIPLVHNHGSNRRITTATKNPSNEIRNENFYSKVDQEPGDEWANGRPPGLKFSRPPGVDYSNFHPEGRKGGTAEMDQTIFRGETPPKPSKPFAKLLFAMYPEPDKLQLGRVDKSGARNSLYTKNNNQPSTFTSSQRSESETENEDSRRPIPFSPENNKAKIMGPYNIKSSDFYRMLQELNEKNGTENNYSAYPPVPDQQQSLPILSTPQTYYQRKYFAPLSSLPYLPPLMYHHHPASLSIAHPPIPVPVPIVTQHLPIVTPEMYNLPPIAEQISPPFPAFENREYYIDPNVTKRFNINLSNDNNEQNNNIPLFWDGKSPMNISITQRDPENHTIFTYVFDPTEYIRNMSKVASTDTSKISISSHSNFNFSDYNSPSKFKHHSDLQKHYYLSNFITREKPKDTKINTEEYNDTSTLINIYPNDLSDSKMSSSNTLKEYYSAIPEESLAKIWTQKKKERAPKKLIRIELGKSRNQTSKSDFKSKIEPLIITSIFRQFLTDLKKNVTRQETARKKLHFSYRLGPEYFKKELGLYEKKAPEENFQSFEDSDQEGEFYYGGERLQQDKKFQSNENNRQEADKNSQNEKVEDEESAESDEKEIQDEDESSQEEDESFQDKETDQNFSENGEEEYNEN